MKIWFDYAFRVVIAALTIAIGVIAWQGQRVLDAVDSNGVRISDNDKRLSAIEANRYTAIDALNDQRQWMSNIQALDDKMRSALEDQKTWMEVNYPPPWLREDITELKAEIKAIREELRKKM